MGKGLRAVSRDGGSWSEKGCCHLQRRYERSSIRYLLLFTVVGPRLIFFCFSFLVLDAVSSQIRLGRMLFEVGVEKGFYAKVSRLGDQWFELDLVSRLPATAGSFPRNRSEGVLSHRFCFHFSISCRSAAARLLLVGGSRNAWCLT